MLSPVENVTARTTRQFSCVTGARKKSTGSISSSADCGLVSRQEQSKVKLLGSSLLAAYLLPATWLFLARKLLKINIVKYGGGGSRTPVRKALRRGAYMLISVPVAIRLHEPLFRQPRSERARNAAG